MIKKRSQKKYKSVITRRICRATQRLALAGLVLVFLLGVAQIGGTNAGFSDVEESAGNTFSAASLDGEATYIERFSVTGMNPEQSPYQRITFSNEGGLDFRYGIKFLKTGGDDVLCNAFILTAKRNGVSVYTGLLKDFIDINQSSAPVVPFEIARFGHDNWNFQVELPANASSALENKNCQWNFDFTAWQTDMPDATQGFSDVESVGTHSIATGEWLTPGDVIINEVMWMGSTVSPADEWIELKNMTGKDIPLAGWKIENAGPNNGTITLPTGAFIPANGYYLIANYDKDNSNSALNVSPDWFTTIVELLNSNNGELVLKNNTTPALVLDSALGTPDWPAGTLGESAGLHQSMERNNESENNGPGDGTLSENWHICASENGTTFWDAGGGNNFGTPGKANHSPVVMNEFVANPVSGDNQQVELYNLLEKDYDVSGWYFKNSNGDKIIISENNIKSGKTIIPGKGRLVVDLGKDFLDSNKDTLSFYSDMKTPDAEADDVKEDVYAYEDSTKKAGDSIMRIPDGVGIWIDPEATIGEENKLDEKETDAFRVETFDKCFDEKGALNKKNKEEICAPAFLQYLGMIKELDDKKIKDSTLMDILDMIIKEEENKLATLLEETAAMTAGEIPATDAPEKEKGESGADENKTTPVAVVDGALEVIDDPVAEPKDDITAEIKKEDVAPEAEPPAEKIKETPADEPKETPVVETPVN